MRKRDDEERPSDSGEPAPWLRLAQEEIGLRMDAEVPERELALDRELEMLARMRTRYPEIPVELAIEFSDRLASGSFTSESWDDTVAWLEATQWFRRSLR